MASEVDDGQITRLLQELGEDPRAFQRLTELIYNDIHQLARYQRLGQPDSSNTLQTTALVHEAILKVFSGNEAQISDRAHLMRLMMRVMRQLIVDHARKQLSRKRGGDAVQVPLEDANVAAPQKDAALVLDMERALKELEAFDPQLVELVTARYYANCSTDDLVELIGKSRRTVYRELERASAWLKLELGRDSAQDNR